MNGKEPRIALVAGEVSGDALGAGLIRALSKRYPDAVFEGVSGPEMAAAGCRPLALIDELALFGLGEVVGEIPRLLRLRRRLYRHWTERRPDVFVGIDAPAFNTGLERRLRAAGIRTVHYVCPTAWAWRERRVRKLRKAVDLMLAIFPFEEAFFARHGVPVRYVGHRLADELPLHPDADAARAALGLPAAGRWLGLLPGSRLSEVRRLGPAFIDTALWLRRRLPDIAFVAPMAGPGVAALFRAQLRERAPDLTVHLSDGRSREVMRAADALLVASGTATLESLLAKTPMVVAYAVSPLTYRIVRHLRLLKTEHVSMPNLLAGRSLVPEFLQQEVQPEILGPSLQRLLTSPAARAAQVDAFDELHERLRRNADTAAAAAVAEVLGRSA
jgi:lipid-A-disaccharide synthase